MTDLEIANSIKLKDISEIAKIAGIKEDELEFYGKYKAKINDRVYDRLKSKKKEN